MTQKEEKSISDELKALNEVLQYLQELDEEQEEWFNSEENKRQHEAELRLRHKEYRENQI